MATGSSRTEYEGALDPGERLVGVMSVDGFFASAHSLFPSSPAVAFTDRRYVLFSKRGALKKRVVVDASWPLAEFPGRVNSNEGTALGPYLYVLTLFTDRDESVSAGFKREKDRESFKALVVAAFDPGNS